MAANGQMVTNTVTVTWGGSTYRIPRGTIIDSPAASGSNLSQTIGSSNLANLTAQQQGGSPGDCEPELSSYVPPGLSYNPGQN